MLKRTFDTAAYFCGYNNRGMAKLGRPKLPKGKTLEYTVRVRFSEAERQRMQKLAQANKQSLSAWIRKAVA